MKENMIKLLATTTVMQKLGEQYPTQKTNGEPCSPQVSTYNLCVLEYEVIENLLFE